jgi:hypothetical protein
VGNALPLVLSVEQIAKYEQPAQVQSHHPASFTGPEQVCTRFRTIPGSSRTAAIVQLANLQNSGQHIRSQQSALQSVDAFFSDLRKSISLAGQENENRVTSRVAPMRSRYPNESAECLTRSYVLQLVACFVGPILCFLRSFVRSNPFPWIRTMLFGQGPGCIGIRIFELTAFSPTDEMPCCARLFQDSFCASDFFRTVRVNGDEYACLTPGIG